MGIIVGIVIVVVLALIVATTAGGEGQEGQEPFRYLDQEELADLEEGRRWREMSFGPEPAAPNYFDRLMTPGSDEDAWHNAALEEGHDPEDW